MTSDKLCKWITSSPKEIFLGDWEELQGLCANYPHPTTAEIATWAADEALFDSGTSTRTSLLFSLLALPDTRIRRATFVIVEQLYLGDDERELVPLLKNVTESTDEIVRMDNLEFLMSVAPIIITHGLFAEDSGAKLLGFLTEDSGEGRMELMRQWYSIGDETLRFAVADALGDVPSQDVEAIELLLDAAIDKSATENVREVAFGSLAKHYPELDSLLNEFANVFFCDGDSLACSDAAEELWKHTYPSRLNPLLLRLFDFCSVSLRAAISFTLAKQNGLAVSHEAERLSTVPSSNSDYAALLNISKDPKDFGLELLAEVVANEQDDYTAFEAAEATLGFASERPTLVRKVIDGTLWREDFFRNLDCALPDWATNEVLRRPDADLAVVDHFFRYPEEPGFAASIIAYGDIAAEEALAALKGDESLSKDSVPFLLRAAGDAHGKLEAIGSAIYVVDSEGSSEMLELKHTLIPLLLHPMVNATRIIRTVAKNNWLRRQLWQFASFNVRHGIWIGRPREIVDNFLGMWLRKLSRTNRPSYDVGRHGAFKGWLRSECPC